MKKRYIILTVCGLSVAILTLLAAMRCRENHAYRLAWENIKSSNIQGTVNELTLPSRFTSSTQTHKTSYGETIGLSGYALDGEIVIPPQFVSAAWEFSENLAWVSTTGGELGYIHPNGKWAFSVDADLARDFCCERAGIGIIKPNGYSLWGYIDKDGDIIVMPTYARASSYIMDYAIVSKPTLVSSFLEIIAKNTGFGINACFAYKTYIIDKSGHKVSAKSLNENI